MYKRKILIAAVITVLSVSLCGCRAMEHVQEKAATCTDSGNVEYWTDGTKFFADAHGKEELESVTVPALGHEYVVTENLADCTTDGERVIVCSRCDFSDKEILTATGHLFGDYVLIRAAECEEDGLKVRVCSVCKDTEECVIPAFGHTIGADNACTRGDWKIPVTDGLIYALTGSIAFEVSGFTGTAVELVLPVYYEAKPVTGIANEAFKDNLDLISVKTYGTLTRIGPSAFRGCGKMKKFSTDGLEFLGNYAFYNCTALEEIRLGAGLKEIGISAFYNCSALTEITIPATLEKIESNAFHGCEGLTIHFEGTKAEWEQVEKAKDWTNMALRVVCSNGAI